MGQALGLQRGRNPGLCPGPAYGLVGQTEMEQEIIIQWGWTHGGSSLGRASSDFGVGREVQEVMILVKGLFTGDNA